MDKGFVMLSRKFFSHKMWEAARTFSECEAWLDLIQSARFDATRPERVSIGGREVVYERGQYPASIRFLSKRWRWGEQKVRSFLSKLKKEKMIVTDDSQGVTVITLCNYEEYNTPNNTANNTRNDLKSNQLSDDVTQQITQLVAQELEKQHSSNTNNKKEEEENYIITPDGDNDMSKNPPDSSTVQESINYQDLVDWFNNSTKGIFGNIRYPLSDTRKGMIRARIREYGKRTFYDTILKAYASDFLKGSNSRGFKATFDWIIKPTNFEKILSGNYDNKNSRNNTEIGFDEEFARSVSAGLAKNCANLQVFHL